MWCGRHNSLVHFGLKFFCKQLIVYVNDVELTNIEFDHGNDGMVVKCDDLVKLKWCLMYLLVTFNS